MEGESEPIQSWEGFDMNEIARILFLGILTLLAPLAKAASLWIACQPAGVMEHPDRIHIRCAQATGGISYYAIATTNKERANRFQSLGTAALLGGKTLWVYFEQNDTSGTSIGCPASDCRIAQMMEIR